MYALIFWPKENATSVIQTTLINKRFEFNRVTVRWGRQNVTAFLIAESEDIVWLKRLIVNTCGVITGYVNDRLMTDACIQCSTSSQDGNGAVDNSLGHSSNHFQFDSVATAEIVERTAIAVASTTPDVVVIPTMDPNAPTTLDSASDAAVNLPAAPTSFTALDVVGVFSMDPTTTLNTLTALDVDVDAADNPKATTSSFATETAVVVSAMDPITPTASTTPDIAAFSAFNQTITPNTCMAVDIAAAPAVDLTAIPAASTSDVVVIPTMDPIMTPNAPTTLDSASDAAVNLPAAPTSFTALDIVGVFSMDPTILSAVTALDVDADAAENLTVTPSSFTTEVAAVILSMDPTTPPSAFITPDTAAVFALDLSTTPSASTTPHIPVAATVDLTATLTPLPILDIATVSALDLTTTRSTSTSPDIGVVSAMDLTTKSSTLTTLSVAAAAPVNGDFAVPSTSTSTGNRAMVALMEGRNVLIEYHKKKDVLRFINKPKEMTRRLLLSIIGREQLKRLTLTEIKLNPLLFGILSAVEKFTLQNSDTEHQLTTDQFNKCVTSFLYNLKHSKNHKLM
ncbi:uncharacterized protein LOC141529319 [Cotesia typhae]|uniref:uncharacterized protein LOC141529319 n=1 Tax=Cotesia typhae TaxID=2053667 RepID=UPI003D685D61